MNLEFMVEAVQDLSRLFKMDYCTYCVGSIPGKGLGTRRLFVRRRKRAGGTLFFLASSRSQNPAAGSRLRAVRSLYHNSGFVAINHR